MSKCESCRKGYNGRNGNGYMPCGCKSKDDLSDADLLRQAHETLEARPRYVEPPPLIPIGHPRLGWKPKPFNSDPYKNLNIALLFIISICMLGLGVTIGVML